MRPPETLTTTRLRLRRTAMADAEFVFASYAQDEEVTRYLNWSPHASITETRAFLARCEACWTDGSAFPWVIERRADGAPLGMFELRITGARADFGYVLARRYWGNGYMTEVVAAVGDWVLAQPELHRYWAVCDIDNHASRRVLEKAGLAREGILRRWEGHPAAGERPRDCACYALVKE